MTRDEAAAEIKRLRAYQKEVWCQGLAKYLEMRSCDLGLCGKVLSMVDAANACSDPKKRGEMEGEIKHLRECRGEAWRRVDGEITQIEIAIDVLRRRSDGEA